MTKNDERVKQYEDFKKGMDGYSDITKAGIALFDRIVAESRIPLENMLTNFQFGPCEDQSCVEMVWRLSYQFFSVMLLSSGAVEWFCYNTKTKEFDGDDCENGDISTIIDKLKVFIGYK